MKKRFGWIQAASMALILMATALAVHSTTASYEPDSSGNRVTFYAHSTGHDFTGRTSRISGAFGGDRSNLEETAFGEVRIPVRTLSTGIDGRDENMYESMDADGHPTIRFELTDLRNISWEGSDTFSATAVGHLTIKGTTRTVPVPLRVSFRDDGRIRMRGGAHLRMTQFGIDPPGFLFFQVSDDVRISFSVLGKPA